MTAPITVVVAEDEAIIRMDLVEVLREEGYDVVADTGRGDEAVALVTEHQPDLALLDIKMPGRDGIETLRELKKRRLSPEVIMLTGRATLESALEAMRIGAYDYLTKPCKLEELGVLLDKAVEKGEAILDVASDAIAALITDPDTWAPAGDKRDNALAGVAFRDKTQ